MRAYWRMSGESLPVNLNDAFVISDTHFNHANIVKYEPIRQTLGADHNRVMIDRWQQTVGDGDVVLHLGDLALGKSGDFMRIAEQLPGRKLLVKGNHDKHSNAWYADHGFRVVDPFWIGHGDWAIAVSHEPFTDLYDHHLSLHGHVHSCGREDRKLPDRRFINVSVEVIDFRPIRLVDLLDSRIQELMEARCTTRT